MDPLFEPRTVAIVGASRDRKKLGNVILHNFMRGKFKGKVFPVNPNATSILGLKCYPSVEKIPGTVDQAVIVVPAAVVPAVLKDCGAKKVKAAVIITSGFSEVGAVELENEVRRLIQKYDIKTIGTNCIGIFDPSTGVDTLFLPPARLNRPGAGSIGFITQSGAVGSAAMDLAGRQGLGFSKFVSYGNATGLDETDLLEMLGRDPETKVILLYVEGVRRGQEFMATARRVAAKKPVIVLKAGRTEAGARAAASHTGSLAGSGQVFDAVIRQTNMIPAHSIAELFDYARVFSTNKVPKGKRVLIITNGGGAGVLTADAVVQSGLELAVPSERTVAELAKRVPSYAVLHNPLDLVGDADAARYEAALRLAAQDPGVDSLVVIVLYQTASLEPTINDVVVRAARASKKPLVAVSIGGQYVERQRLAVEKAGVPTFEEPERAVRALARLTEYHLRRPAP